ncbi:hypothetical protein EYC84_006541 [Monilinia fructicola]|uniref:Uncharacterized protein n=1 Tax=Monilinia fructicola TaxID=38448 RepID=A0A5M9KBX6_MONFR|nr:hypothetical protein EYC84_006541 [Monilinia fructicola]
MVLISRKRTDFLPMILLNNEYRLARNPFAIKPTPLSRLAKKEISLSYSSYHSMQSHPVLSNRQPGIEMHHD